MYTCLVLLQFQNYLSILLGFVFCNVGYNFGTCQNIDIQGSAYNNYFHSFKSICNQVTHYALKSVPQKIFLKTKNILKQSKPQSYLKF